MVVGKEETGWSLEVGRLLAEMIKLAGGGGTSWGSLVPGVALCAAYIGKVLSCLPGSPPPDFFFFVLPSTFHFPSVGPQSSSRNKGVLYFFLPESLLFFPASEVHRLHLDIMQMSSRCITWGKLCSHFIQPSLVEVLSAFSILDLHLQSAKLSGGQRGPGQWKPLPKRACLRVDLPWLPLPLLLSCPSAWETLLEVQAGPATKANTLEPWEYS